MHTQGRWRQFRRDRAAALSAVAALVMSALCVACGEHNLSRGSAPSGPIVFNGAEEDLTAYDPVEGTKQLVVFGGEDEHAGGLSLNGQVCFDPQGTQRFVMGDDAGQNPPTNIPPGWSVMQLHGDHVGALSVTQIVKLTPTYVGANDDPYGCGWLSGDRILTTDIGNQAQGSGNGQLILWFPPFTAGATPRYCKLDITVGTAGSIWVDATDHVYVASARAPGGIYRYSPPFPTSDDAIGGCGGHDATGAPLADHVNKERFIVAGGSIPNPNSVVGTNRGTFYISSILNGVIAEYGSDGKYIRKILQPPAGEKTLPYSTGTPLGIGIDASGTVYYADIGLSGQFPDIGLADHGGSVRRIRFANGDPTQPLPPEPLGSGLDFPDGIGILE